MNWQSEENVVKDMNRVLRGWVNYFDYGTLWKTYSKLEQFIITRMRSWLVRKYKVETRGIHRYSASYLYESKGLINLAKILTPRRTA